MAHSGDDPGVCGPATRIGAARVRIPDLRGERLFNWDSSARKQILKVRFNLDVKSLKNLGNQALPRLEPNRRSLRVSVPGDLKICCSRSHARTSM